MGTREGGSVTLHLLQQAGAMVVRPDWNNAEE
jgi:hypothetical protein